MSGYKLPQSALVIVYTKAHKTLLLHRHEPDYFWQSVAGSLLEDEEPHSAAVRELQEETGIVVSKLEPYDKASYIIYPMWRHRYAPGVIENTEYAYTLELEEECEIVLDGREHKEYQWVDKAKVADMVSSHTNRSYIERILNAQ